MAWRLGRSKRLTNLPEYAEMGLFASPKAIKIDGLSFVIRKINVLDYLEGAKVIAETFSTYKTGKDPSAALANLDTANINRIKKYMTDIICAGVIKPKFVREAPKEGEILIDEIFMDWILVQKLSQAIFDHTHGKKK